MAVAIEYGKDDELNKSGIHILPYLFPLNVFMATFGGFLVIIFLSTGIILLKTLKKYSDKIYQNSKCKIIFILVMWSLGVIFQVAT